MTTSLWVCCLKLVLLLAGLAVAFHDQIEDLPKSGRNEPLDIGQTLNRIRRDILTAGTTPREESKNEGNRSKQLRRFNGRRRCFLGSAYDCPPALEGTLYDWPSPWGWTPGPLYPEYGPHFHRGWIGNGGPFGCNHCGCGGPWRGPGCSCGCNNHGWCCCGGGGGGRANDCSQCNDAFNDAPSTSQRPSQVNHPPLLQPLMGKHANFKAPLQIKPSKNKNVRRGYKRYDVTYSTGDPYGMSTSPGYEYPCDPSYGNWPCQTPQAAPQQTSPADQVVGTLFLWKPNNLANDKPLPKKNPKANPKN